MTSDAGALRRARIAVAAIFFLNGAGVASWVVRIPAVQERLGLTPGVLGLALLGGAVGALVAMPLAGRWVVRRGSGPVTRVTALGFAAVLLLPPFASDAVTLTLALVAFGAGNGVLDVAMNAQAATVERGYGRPIMSGFHAMFSAGGLVGAAIGGVVAGADVAPTTHLVVAALLVGAAVPFTTRPLLPAGVDAAAAGAHAIARPTPLLLALGALAFCVLVAEGAMADWSAVYLGSVVGAGHGLAAAGYAAFSVMMASGRAIGDALTLRLGAPRLVRLGGALAAIGIGLALIAREPWTAVVGFGAVGAGLATVFPSVLGAASRAPGIEPGAGIALVSTLGYTGFLAGPPLIGFVAEATNLRGGLAVVGAAGVLVALLAGALRRAAGATAAAGLAEARAQERATAA
jgi:predicted MFS family arabinose efflux permease